MWKSEFRQNYYRISFSPTVPPFAARISRVVADGGTWRLKWERLKQWQTTPKNSPRMQCARAIPVTWLGSDSCQARPSRLNNNNEWMSICLSVTARTDQGSSSVYVPLHPVRWNRGSAVSIVTRLRAERCGWASQQGQDIFHVSKKDPFRLNDPPSPLFTGYVGDCLPRENGWAITLTSYLPLVPMIGIGGSIPPKCW